MLTQDFLKSILFYDPESGEFTWIAKLGYKTKIGSIAGTTHQKNEPYVSIRINGKAYRAHRLAWFYMTGEWPKKFIDHKNGMVNDNRWQNIRQANESQNNCNRRNNIHNTSGHRNVIWIKKDKTWEVVITVKGKKQRFGRFKNLDDAATVACKLREKLHGEFFRQ